jgi:exodeoxyribonuclease V alpha subunit
VDLTPEQLRSVALATSPVPPRVVAVTGSAGTGKTTTINEVIRRLRELNRTVALAAPSGKAAQRMSDVTGEEAATIHRLLGLRPDGPPEPRPLRSDVLILDEASMIDVELMAQVFASCFGAEGRVGTLLLVGDAGQLPPVGPGEPFNDLLAAPGVPSVVLSQVMRQDKDSGILNAATEIREGRPPEWADDFRLVECPDAANVPEAVWSIVNEHGLDPRTSQVLCPQKTLAAGTESICKYVEEHRLGADSPPLLRGKFRDGTKVIHTKNDYNLDVFNGTLGFVVGTRGEENKPRTHEIDAAMGEKGERKLYRGAQLKMLRPAWALSVHRSQGSQWPDVIFVCHRQHTHMLRRKLLYVAVTRASRRVWVVGTQEAVERAVANRKEEKRRTMLKRWLPQLAARSEGVGV